MNPAPAPPRWLHPAIVMLVLAVAVRAAIDGHARSVYAAAAGVALLYVVLYHVFRRLLGDDLTAKRSLQLLSATALSMTTTASIFDGALRAAPLTGWNAPIAWSLAIELGVTAASLATFTRTQLAMPALILHHVLLLLACDYVTLNRFGTGVIVATLFQETTNVGWYLHWILNSPESGYHARWPRLFNVNAIGAIGWYAIGRFGIALPVLCYLLWLTPHSASLAYLGLFVVGLITQTIMNVQNLVKLARSYPRCTSSWLHRPSAVAASNGPRCQGPGSLAAS